MTETTRSADNDKGWCNRIMAGGKECSLPAGHGGPCR